MKNEVLARNRCRQWTGNGKFIWSAWPYIIDKRGIKGFTV